MCAILIGSENFSDQTRIPAMDCHSCHNKSLVERVSVPDICFQVLTAAPHGRGHRETVPPEVLQDWDVRPRHRQQVRYLSNPLLYHWLIEWMVRAGILCLRPQGAAPELEVSGAELFYLAGADILSDSAAPYFVDATNT